MQPWWATEQYHNEKLLREWYASNAGCFTQRQIPGPTAEEKEEKVEATNPSSKPQASKPDFFSPRSANSKKRPAEEKPPTAGAEGEETQSDEDDEKKDKEEQKPKKKSRTQKKSAQPKKNDKSKKDREEPVKKAEVTNKSVKKANIACHEKWELWEEKAQQLVFPSITTFPKTEFDACKVKFNGRRVLYFETMYHLKHLPGGTAVGNRSTYEKVAKSKQGKNKLPPFLVKRNCVTDKEWKAQCQKMGEQLWFLCVFDKHGENQDPKALVLWKDLLGNDIDDLSKMVRFTIGKMDGDAESLQFVQSCFFYALFSKPKTSKTTSK
jgi:flagellar biosynthesis GTPase FlhF